MATRSPTQTHAYWGVFPTINLPASANVEVGDTAFDSTLGTLVVCTAVGPVVWTAVGGGGGTIAGTIAANEVAFGTAPDTIGGSANFTYNAGGSGTLEVTGAGDASNALRTSTGKTVFESSVAGDLVQVDPLLGEITIEIPSVAPVKAAYGVGQALVAEYTDNTYTTLVASTDMTAGTLSMTTMNPRAVHIIDAISTNDLLIVDAANNTLSVYDPITGPGPSATISAAEATIADGAGLAGTVAPGLVRAVDGSGPLFVSLKAPGPSGAVALVSDDGAGSAQALDLVIGELQVNANPGAAGEVLTSNGPGVAPTWQAGGGGGGITELTGDVVAGPGSGSQAATVKSFGGKIHWVVVGGKYATLQDAVDAASANDVIIVGPIGTVASGTWGDVTFPVTKRLSVIGLNGARGTSVRIGKVTFAPTGGTGNINENEVFLRNLLINADFAGSQGVRFGGSALARLRLQECFIFNSGASGDCVVSNNTAAPSGGTSSSLYLDGCVVQTANSTSVLLKNVSGYTVVRNSQFDGGQYALQGVAGVVECFSSFFEMNAAAREVVRVEGAQVSMTYCRIINSNATGVGATITTAYAPPAATALFGMNNSVFIVGGASPGAAARAVTGINGGLYAYGQVTYAATNQCRTGLIFSQSAQTHSSVVTAYP